MKIVIALTLILGLAGAGLAWRLRRPAKPSQPRAQADGGVPLVVADAGTASTNHCAASDAGCDGGGGGGGGD